MIIFLIGGVQFVNIVDFMMVMPLGPDFAKALDISFTHLGVVAGCYTLSAALSGMLCSLFLDRFDRKSALLFMLAGLVVGTALGACATNLTQLLMARFIAGAFGGPASSVALSVVSDIIPVERRGKALGTVMMAFSLASIAGVPVGLELAHWGNWQTPFLAVALLGMVMWVWICYAMPRLNYHMQKGDKPDVADSMKRLFSRPTMLLSYALIGCMNISGFVIFPNIASFVQQNLGYPRDKMSLLYLAGGLASLASMRLVGGITDRMGALPVFSFGSFAFGIVVFLGFFLEPPFLSPMAIFVIMMLAGTIRNVTSNTMISRVPRPEERAGFMSVQSAVQHLAAAAGGFFSTQMLSESADHKLIGMHNIAIFSLVLIVVGVGLMKVLRHLLGLEKSDESQRAAFAGPRP